VGIVRTSKQFGSFKAVDQVSLEIEQLTCGLAETIGVWKESTLLRLIAGLEMLE